MVMPAMLHAHTPNCHADFTMYRSQMAEAAISAADSADERRRYRHRLQRQDADDDGLVRARPARRQTHDWRRWAIRAAATATKARADDDAAHFRRRAAADDLPFPGVSTLRRMTTNADISYTPRARSARR